MIGIYKITSPNNKIYIGQSINIEKRFTQYKKIKSCCNQIKLYNSFIKYGVDNHLFEVIEECNIEFLNQKERYWQDYYDCINSKGLNLKLTKTSDKSGYLSEDTKEKIRKKAIGREVSKDTRLKLSILRKGKNGAMLGKKHSNESKLKISLSNIGKVHSKETRLKISKSNLGKISGMFGKKHSNITKDKMSLSLLGNKRGCNKIMSENEKQNLKNKFSKIILNLETGIFYLGTKEAAFYNNLNPSTLKNRLNGNLKNNTNLIYC